ncbi:MADS-box protein [Salix suchowensis]|nr:MADS-box protein [Salix suchowensis]
MKKRQQEQHINGRENGSCQQNNHYQLHLQKQIQCNKGKTCRFKRSSSSLEEDGASSAILLLACIACTPSY